MNITEFLKAAERASVLSIADLDEAVSFWGAEYGDLSNNEVYNDLHDVLTELDREGYIVYTDVETLEEFLADIDPEDELTILQD